MDNAYTTTPGPLGMKVEVTSATGSDPTSVDSRVMDFKLEEVLTSQPTPEITVLGENPTMAAANFKAGAEVQYSFGVYNKGAVTLTHVTSKISASGTGAISDVNCTPTLDTLVPTAGLSDCTVTYKLTQEDIDKGSASVTLSADGTYGSGAKDVVKNGLTETLTVAPLGSVSLTKTVSGPADPADFKAGAKLEYTFVVTNTGNATLTDLELTEDDQEFTGSGPVPTISCPEGALASLALGDSVSTCTAEYTLVEDDINRSSVHNGANVTGNYYTATYSQTASISIGLQAAVSQLTTPQVGDTLTYTFTITNTGNATLTDWELTVPAGGFTGTGTLGAIDCPQAGTDLVPGETVTVTCTTTYQITEEDLEAGGVDLTVQVNAKSPAGTVTPEEATAKSTLVASGGISLAKTAVFEPNQSFVAGAKVDFHFEVKNTGTLDTDNAVITEDSSFGLDMSGCAVPNPLTEGDIYGCDVTYELTQADVDAGLVTNTASVDATFKKNGEPTPPRHLRR